MLERPTQYVAFISYSHQADRKLAPTLQSALQRFGRPWYRIRWISIFRDDTDLGISPQLWSSVEQALSQSEYFLLLASPLAAQSRWVQKEVEYWRRNRSLEKLLIVLTDGEIVWQEGARDFDWKQTTALPNNLADGFSEIPLYADLRDFRNAVDLSVSNPAFLSETAKLAATIHNRPLKEMFGEEVKQRRFRKIFLSAIILILMISTAAAIWNAIAANKAARLARSRELAAASRLERSNNPDLSVLLAERAFRTSPTSEALVALRDALLGSPLRIILRGHSDALTDAAFSPDGRLVLTASLDKTARLWDAANGNLLRVFSGHTALVNRAAFSPVGTYILTASEDGSARIWNATSGDPACPALQHSRGVRDASFSSDGKRVVTGSLDGTARVWDISSCALLAELPHPRGIAKVAFSNDGHKILTAGFDDNTRVWDADNWVLVATFHHQDANYAVFSPDGSKIVTAGLDGSPKLWDLTSSTPTPKSLGHLSLAGQRAAFSPDGKSIVVAGVRPAAQIWSAQTGELVAEWSEAAEDLDPSDAGNPGVAEGFFSPDGSEVVTRIGNSIRVWDVGSGRRIALFKGHANSVQIASFSPDGMRVVSASFDHTARIWQVNSARHISSLGDMQGPLEHATFSPDGKLIAAATSDNGVRIWHVGKAAPSQVLRSGSRSFQKVAFSADERHIVAQTTPYAQVWDVATGETQRILRPPVIVEAVEFPQFSPDSTRIIAGSAIDARIWNVETGAILKDLRGHKDAVTYSAFSPDGKQVVTGSRDRTARIWDLASGKTLHVLSGHSEPIAFVGFSPNGKYLVTASWDYTARTWDGQSGQPLAVFVGHSRPLTYASFSRDGRWIATLSYDQTVRIWDAAVGQEIAKLWNSTDRILAISFMSGSNNIIALSQSGKLIVLDCELCTTNEVLLQLAAKRVFRQPSEDEIRRYHLDARE